MADSDRGNPIQLTAVVLLLVGGGWYFLHHYRIDGLDEVSVSSKPSNESQEQYISYNDVPSFLDSADSSISEVQRQPESRAEPNDFATVGRTMADFNITASPPRKIRGLKIASWALDGFGPTKLANPAARQNVARVIRQFDVVALQQIASIERDLIPRLVEAINQGDGRYDFVVGPPTGPSDRPEQLAFIFDADTHAARSALYKRYNKYYCHGPHCHECVPTFLPTHKLWRLRILRWSHMIVF